jgi:hypothetical protein
MSKFKSRLARFNTVNCDQIMPVPLIPLCAIACRDPKPICIYKDPHCILSQSQQQSQQQTQQQSQLQSPPMSIPNYNPLLPVPPAGTILTNTTNALPPGYLLCNGSPISRTTYSNLFTVIGTTYGEGDGSTTFNLPNLNSECTPCNKTYIIKI